jgi:peptidyl-prolyl cis-trans isomerase B (cyclophilin B)
MRSRFLHLVTPVAMLLAIWAAAPGCGSDEAEQAPREMAAPPSVVPPPPPQAPRPVAVISVENFGEIRVELLPEVAPATVGNFVKLAEEKFYDGTTFHRVIPDFMIQGGDPNSKNRDPRDDGSGGPGYTIEDEFSEISHTRGMVSMANTGRPKSGGSQFFITVKDKPHLDGGYSLFGRVLDGMEVADRITTVERDQYARHGPKDRPLENVVIASIRIEHPESAQDPASRPKAEATFSEWDEGAPES